MAEFMMLMKGAGKAGDWVVYIDKLISSRTFRGGSELAKGSCLSKAGSNSGCSVTGFMRFEADTKEQVLALLPGNPVYESGGSIEVLARTIHESGRPPPPNSFRMAGPDRTLFP